MKRTVVLVLAVVVPLAAALVLALLDRAQIPVGYYIAGTAIATVVAVLITLAIEDETRRVLALAAAIVLLVAGLGVIVIYNATRPSAPEGIGFVVRGDGLVVDSVGEPFGTGMVLPYRVGSVVRVECQVVLRTSSEGARSFWYRLDSGDEWMPAASLSYPTGLKERPVPTCPDARSEG